MSFELEQGQSCQCPTGSPATHPSASQHSGSGAPVDYVASGETSHRSADEYERELDQLAKEYAELRQAAKRARDAAVEAAKADLASVDDWKCDRDFRRIRLESVKMRLLAIAVERELLAERRKSLDTLYRMAHKRRLGELVDKDRETADVLRGVRKSKRGAQAAKGEN
jgi:hypothetical protein